MFAKIQGECLSIFVAEDIIWHMDIPEFERRICEGGVFKLKSATKYLASSTVRVWGIGMRPFFAPLINIANSFVQEVRWEIKA